MADFLDIFYEWFGQGFSFPVIAVDIAFFLLGLLITLKNPRGSRIILGTAAVLLLSLFGGQAHSYMIAIVSVILCGISSMFLAGAVIGWLATKLIHQKK